MRQGDWVARNGVRAGFWQSVRCPRSMLGLERRIVPQPLDHCHAGCDILAKRV